MSMRFWRAKDRYGGLAAIFLICSAQAPVDWAVKAGWIVFANQSDKGLRAYYSPNSVKKEGNLVQAKYFTTTDRGRIFFVEIDCPHRTMRLISYDAINPNTGGYIATHDMREYPTGFIPPTHPVNFLSQKLC